MMPPMIGYMRRIIAGNATLGVRILPAQSYADFLEDAVDHVRGDLVSLSSRSITAIDPDLVTTLYQNTKDTTDEVGTIDLSGNAIPSANVNSILAAIVAHNVANFAGTLTINGGTNGAPTGQGLTDKATLIGNGWTVTTN